MRLATVLLILGGFALDDPAMAAEQEKRGRKLELLTEGKKMASTCGLFGNELSKCQRKVGTRTAVTRDYFFLLPLVRSAVKVVPTVFNL